MAEMLAKDALPGETSLNDTAPHAINLSLRLSVDLYPTQPFHFENTFYKPSHFPVDCRRSEPGRYWQAMRFNEEIFGIRVVDLTRDSQPHLQLDIYSDSLVTKDVADGIAAELSWRFDLQLNLDDFASLSQGDALLRLAFNRMPGMRVSCSYSLYELIVVTLMLQNTTVRRSTQMLRALFSSFGTIVKFDGVELFGFWSPATVAASTEEYIRSLKIGYRAKSLHRFSQQFADGAVEENTLRTLGKGDARKQLLSLYGVGPASVNYLLFEALHHYDALDTISPWEQKIYTRLLFETDGSIPVPKLLGEINSRWGRWQMLAMHYVFEDLFLQHKSSPIPWLQELIRL